MPKKIKIKEIKKDVTIKTIDTSKVSLESSVSTQEFTDIGGRRVTVQGLSTGSLSANRSQETEAPQPERRELTNAEVETMRYDSARVYRSQNKYDPTINSQVLPESKTTIRSTMVEDSSLLRNRGSIEQQGSSNPFSQNTLSTRDDSGDKVRREYDEGVRKERKKSSMF